MSRTLFAGASLLALLATPALAQTTSMPAQTNSMPASSAAMAPAAPASYVVHFAFDSSKLDAGARETVSQAARAYQQNGQARVAVTGHTDTAGTPSYNQALSQRRAESVERELVRQGVPASAITVRGDGEADPVIATGPGVREPANRRVEISMPEPAMAPMAAAPPVTAMPAEPAPMAAMAPPPPPPPKFELALGGFYGHNFRESDNGTDDDLAGGELSVGYLPSPNVRLRLDQAWFGSFNALNSGPGGRTVLGLDFQANLGAFHPYIGVNAGGLYGEGVQDGFIAGPEAGFRVDFTPRTFMYAKAAYDYQSRNTWDKWDDFDHGDVVGGVGVGVRF